MENKASNDSGWEAFHEEEEQYDDVLSLCNLSMQESSSHSSALQTPRASSFSSPREFFQFSSLHYNSGDDERYFSAPEIIFCGKIIQQEQRQLNEYQKRDYLTLRRPDPVKPREDPDPARPPPPPPRTIAKMLSNASSSYQQRQNVNMTGLTSMSAKSRRRMFMFGPVKFNPEMDLSAIKERKGKRLTTLLSPEMMWDGGNAVVANDVSGAAAVAKSGKRSQWRIVKATLKGRAHLSNVLARSFAFGCIPAASAGRNRVQVAN